MAPGIALTDNIFVAMQPVQLVNVIMVMPGATPVTIAVSPVPMLVTVAVLGLMLLHVPQPVVAVYVIEDPTHTALAPVIAGVVFTVTVLVAVTTPQTALIA
jgi:hypothetical protein